MHGPKIAYKRRKGEETAAMACGGGTEQLPEAEVAMHDAARGTVARAATAP
jgi:hypothetical protein